MLCQSYACWCSESAEESEEGPGSKGARDENGCESERAVNTPHLRATAVVKDDWGPTSSKSRLAQRRFDVRFSDGQVLVADDILGKHPHALLEENVFDADVLAEWRQHHQPPKCLLKPPSGAAAGALRR